MNAASEWSHLLDDAERRDPAGHAVHLGLALLFLFTMPLGTAPSNILSAPLLVITILRWRTVGPIVVRLLRWGPTLPALLLAAWMSLTLLWSDDPRLGGHLLLSMRVLALPACLAPLLRRRELLGASLLAGILLEAMVQGGQYASNRLSPDFDGLGRFGGFTSDPGKAALWDALGVCAGAALALLLPWMGAIAGGVITLLSGAGIVASGTRRQLVALAIVLPLMALWTLAAIPARRRRVLAVVAVAALSIAAAWPVVGPSIATRWRQTVSQLSELPKPDDPSIVPPPIAGLVHFDLRAFYWRASIDAWREHPFAGIGLGGTRGATARSPLQPELERWLRQEITREYPKRTAEENEADLRSRLVSSHPHSTWLQLLVETGAVGLALAAAAWLAAFRGAMRRAAAHGTADPVSLAGAAALLLWALGGLFDASINSTSLGAVAVAATLGALPPPPRRG